MKGNSKDKKDFSKDYTATTKHYIQDICDYLNAEGKKYRHYYYYENSREEDYSPKFFYSLHHFLLEIRNHHSLLKEKGLLNRGYCPYTGEKIIDDTFKTVIRGTDMFFSKEGLDTYLIEEENARNSGGCYIATACYGGKNAPEVMELRIFRDQVLERSFLGQYFIRMYYKFSPKLANHLKKHTFLNSVVRKLILSPFVKLIK